MALDLSSFCFCMANYILCVSLSLPPSPQLCCRNADGNTPFLHALTAQNYAAALSVLDFVEKREASPDREMSELARMETSSSSQDHAVEDGELRAGGWLAHCQWSGLQPLQSS